MGKSDDKRAAIIAQQAARQQAEHPNGLSFSKPKRTNWTSTAPRRPGPGRPPGGSFRR
jgi:hypothetical protein